MAAAKDTFGGNGYRQLTSADGVVTDEFYAIKAVDNAPAVVNVTHRQGDNSTGLTIANSDQIYVTATEVEVTSGTVHAYIQG